VRIGIVCYPTYGGSGVLATELGRHLARRGHAVHCISSERPRRLGLADGVRFHAVRTREYPVFPHAPYGLALCSAIVQIARQEGLDLVHAHYAVPHATSAWMAREIVPDLKVVTTLHGTDITLVGSDASYLPITRHSIEVSDAVTVPSAWLRDETWRRFELDPNRTPIEVIPNFIDTDLHAPATTTDRPVLRALFGEALDGVPVVAHVSNFRPVKRVDRVVEVFRRVAERRDCRLVLVGDGPDEGDVRRRVAEAGLENRVRFVGAVPAVHALLRECTAFLLPSETESFGLAAAEALACGVPVVAFAVGGLPEVIRTGETGLLVRPGDLDGMAAALGRILDDPEASATMGAAARVDAVARFRPDPIVAMWEAVYARVVDA
jgi:N-acetyl-alpha-D-glucosaminyl L-malate synthase BshA